MVYLFVHVLWSVSRREAVLRQSPVGRLLNGYRGGRRYDIAAVNELSSALLAAVSQDMRFIEINPEPSPWSGEADVYLRGRSSEILPQVLRG